MSRKVLVRCRPGTDLGRHHQLRALEAARGLRGPDASAFERVELRLGQAPAGARLSVRGLWLDVPADWTLAADLGSRLAALTRRAQPGGEPPAPGERRGAGRPKALFFKSLLNSADKELGAAHLYQGVFYIASALKAAGIACVLVDGRISLEEGRLVTEPEALERALRDNPDVNFVGITLFDAYFEKARALVEFVKSRSEAFVAVGGSMPSQHPRQTLAHLPGVDFLVRGAGEEVVPRMLGILGGSNARTGLSEGQLEALGELGGVWTARPGLLQAASPDHVIRVEDMDSSRLDFSLLDRAHVSAGTVLYFSRGCPYACLFCTSQDKARFTGKSARELARTLSAYGRRLRELYGRWSAVPAPAFGVGFYDDDFLSDRDRAIELFEVFRKSPFHIQFFQSSINSFYRGHGRAGSEELDEDLLDAMPEALFLPKWGDVGAAARRPYVYIGTENYCDEELRRLGKPYRYARVERLVAELSRRRIRQAHHFIVSNARTRPGQILENLERIAALDARHAPYYGVLKPVISHLVSFYSSPSYQTLEKLGLLGCARVRERLSLPGFPELDYPLVDRDLPRDERAREMAALMSSWTTGSWERALAQARAYLGRSEARVAG